MWGTMAKARLLQKTFTLPFCSFKFCSWFSTRKKTKLPSKTFLLHHHHLHRYLSSFTKIREENLCRRFCNAFPILLRPSSTNKKYGRRRFFFLKRQFLWPWLVEWEDNGKKVKKLQMAFSELSTWRCSSNRSWVIHVRNNDEEEFKF